MWAGEGFSVDMIGRRDLERNKAHFKTKLLSYSKVNGLFRCCLHLPRSFLVSGLPLFWAIERNCRVVVQSKVY